jgi:uncharacterized protein YecT (DUF1311 family)
VIACRTGLAGFILALAMAGLVPAGADEVPWHGDFISPPVQAVCDRTAALAPPAADQPSPAEAAALKDCDSVALFYGIGRPADPVAARKCAYAEAGHGEGGPTLAGEPVLAMIYANGRGVRRNYDQAIRMSCKASWAPAELDGRVAHLMELKANPACAGTGAGPAGVCAFDFCDDITSGAMGGVCSSISSRRASVGRQARLVALQAGWSPAQRTAYVALAKALEAYAAAHGRNETDLSGTLRAAFIIEAEDAVKARFEADLKAFEDGRFPKGTAADLAQADGALNAAYKAAMAETYPDMSGIRPQGIRETERAWIAYRDAYVRLAAMRWPALSADALKTKLTRDRTALLKALVEP